MNYYQIQEYKSDIYPAIVLDQVLPRRIRKIIRVLLSIGALLALITLLLPITFFEQNIFVGRSILMFCLSFYIMFLLLEAMYRSYFFEKNKVDIRVFQVLHSNKTYDDLTTRFLKHELGISTMYRLGFDQRDIDEFLKHKTDIVTKKEFEIIENDDLEVSFAEFGFSLVHFDSDLSKLLRSRGVSVSDFKQTLEWIARIDQSLRKRERWWSKDNLLRIPSIGKNLAFGQVYYLESVGHNIYADTSYIRLGDRWRIYKDSVNKIESVLAKSVGGNLLLTAHQSYLTMDAISAFAKEIQQGTVLSTLENKRIYVLDVNMLLSSYDSRTEFESVLTMVLSQASYAGNVILVIPNIADFVEHAHALEIDVKDILRDAIRSTKLQVIITSDERSFHSVIEPDLELMTYFEKVHLNEFDEYQAISILEHEVLYVEQEQNVFFTFQAIKRIVESADRYFTDTSLLDKSIDILYEVVSLVKQKNMYRVTQEYVDELIRSKTGISLGKISNDESFKLSHIKEQMKERIIGQDSAVDAVCDAMLRARTGLANPKRPLASFFFVGPTGVGKTETAKVLAELFFMDEENMLRVDMTEYSDVSALERMIGGEGHIGVFASKVRERGSGVLLLDEFEKSAVDVQDLFLQIIDEGFFTDGRGEKVTMRNFIIIATSNAGSELFTSNQNGVFTRETITQYIISHHMLKTELLNRFDDIIVFNPLDQETLLKITHLAIDRLIKRLDERGITLKETPQLTTYLARIGAHPTFGAREINRVITKQLESKIAQALVLGDLFEGDTISFTVHNDNIEIQKYT